MLNSGEHPSLKAFGKISNGKHKAIGNGLEHLENAVIVMKSHQKKQIE